MMLAPLARETLTKQATDTLRRFIITESLKVGDQLPSERELSENLAVSRNIVREALSALVHEGVIIKKAGRGIFVADFDPRRLMGQIAINGENDLHSAATLGEARMVVELGALGLMVQRITEAQLQQLEAINRSLAENIHTGRATIHDDIEFHKVLIQSTHNDVLMTMIPLLVEHFRQSVVHRPQAIFSNPERLVAEHQAIVQALRRRDQPAARQALLNHFHVPGFPT